MGFHINHRHWGLCHLLSIRRNLVSQTCDQLFQLNVGLSELPDRYGLSDPEKPLVRRPSGTDASILLLRAHHLVETKGDRGKEKVTWKHEKWVKANKHELGEQIQTQSQSPQWRFAEAPRYIGHVSPESFTFWYCSVEISTFKKLVLFSSRSICWIFGNSSKRPSFWASCQLLLSLRASK